MSLLYKFREEGDKRNVHFGKLVCIQRYQFYFYPQAATKSWFQIEGKNALLVMLSFLNLLGGS